ncbi:MAG TPA: glucosamine-6-phosphate deaminase [Phototrophicaceae bacterium]|nr:glucosamine-6-phosphate deaminase [Phototrophicaceae bacterium]
MAIRARVGEMSVVVCGTNQVLGWTAAHDFAAAVERELQNYDEISIIFATGNSQLSFLNALRDLSLPWERISAFHMDEYLGLPADHPASFRRFIREKISEPFHPKATYFIEGDAPDIDAELARYDGLLRRHAPVICVLGVGENGHLAFNDPPADFQTDRLIHVVTLDQVCRQQQVGEGHFPNFDSVPKQAISLTVPALLRQKYLFALVPETRKAKAIQAALEGPVTENLPASILRTQPQVTLYLDHDSAALLRADTLMK